MCKNQKFLGADVQKDLNWMAGSISRKLRGVRVKFWTDLELILKPHGPRVDTRITQGLFRNIARRKGYVLIWALGSGSDGSEKIGS